MQDIFGRLASKVDKLRLKKKKNEGNPTTLLQKVYTSWEKIVEDYEQAKSFPKAVKLSSIPNSLEQIVDCLVQEENITLLKSTGPCMEYFLNNEILKQLVKMSEEGQPVIGLRTEVIKSLTSLVSLMDDSFLTQHAVHKPALDLIKSCIDQPVNSPRSAVIEEEVIIDLMYTLAARIRGHKDLLQIFFNKDVDSEALPSLSITKELEKLENDSSQKFQFPLYVYLMGYLNKDGHCGEYARAALIFILELTYPESPLERYLLHVEDFPTLLIAGLGGVYSTLPRLLPSLQSRRGSVTHTNDLDIFLALIAFLETIIRKCPSETLKSIVLQKFRIMFLDGLLAKSLIESSEFDGSAIALTVYTLRTLNFISEPRITAQFAEALLEEKDKGPELLLTVKDILIHRLSSVSEVLVIANLRLLQVLLTRHCHVVLPLLIGNSSSPNTLMSSPRFFPNKSVSNVDNNNIIDVEHHLCNVSRYFGLLPPLAGQTDTVLGYQNSFAAYQQDAEACVTLNSFRILNKSQTNTELEDLKLNNVLTKSFSADSNIDILSPISEPESVKLSLPLLSRICSACHDYTISKILDMWAAFFSHSMEVNLALSGVVAAFASVPDPAIYMALFSADIIFLSSNDHVSEIPEVELPRRSLYTILVSLMAEVESKKSSMSKTSFDITFTKKKSYLVESGCGSGLVNRQASIGVIDLEDEFYKNVVVLEESIKELVSILQAHMAVGGESLKYI